MTLPEFLTQDQFGYVHLTGHRIGLVDIIHFYNQGDSTEMLAARFPSVSLPMHQQVIAYYLDHQSEVDEYVARHEAEMAQQRAASAGRGPSLEELKARYAAKRLAAGA
jgi:uncharacterized protein (DUF433 family)